MDERGPYLPSGTRVRYDGTGSPEFGVVVPCWMDSELRSYDGHVAFYGERMPEQKPERKPYVLRYLTASLVVVAPGAMSCAHEVMVSPPSRRLGPA